ncbi:aldo/keto reductase [Streptomyces griseoviridis]|uniref:Aryl-alcohol dehydrogenase-like predicted oxidoreductase n=1 Tax=Streptomyces griseoviridis TaxID=45398 RepID=A0ABT9L932_STRGD|nr:aldo/keto reductase [Streptomyces griseoviridis]MDP9680223.1 aryl-alcohol dehydrogenase-like predicted oxidoreductase [Streptomyces griseoviridis]GGT13546.1 oxidoreductase [Streptomyces griseoviridis]
MTSEPTSGAGPAARPQDTGELAGRAVARVGYGAMQLERLRDDRPAAVALLRHAIDLGVDHVDTAQFYGDGFVNDVIREALRPGDDVLVVSKVGAVSDPGGPFPLRLAQRPEDLRASVEANLAALRTERIPVVNLRRVDSGITIPVPDDQVIPLDDQLAEMLALRDEGKIGAIGLSSVSLDVLRHALPAGIVCVQNAYSLVARDDEDVLRLCAEERIAWVPYFPLGGAFPGLPKVTDEPAVRAAAERLGHTPAQIGLAWLLHHSPRTLLIPGTADPAHLEANLAVAAITLDEQARTALDAIPTRPVAGLGH